VGSLNEARETYNADDFPVADEFDELEKKLGSIAGNLNEIIEKQSEAASNGAASVLAPPGRDWPGGVLPKTL